MLNAFLPAVRSDTETIWGRNGLTSLPFSCSMVDITFHMLTVWVFSKANESRYVGFFFCLFFFLFVCLFCFVLFIFGFFCLFVCLLLLFFFFGGGGCFADTRVFAIKVLGDAEYSLYVGVGRVQISPCGCLETYSVHTIQVFGDLWSVYHVGAGRQEERSSVEVGRCRVFTI